VPLTASAASCARGSVDSPSPASACFEGTPAGRRRSKASVSGNSGPEPAASGSASAGPGSSAAPSASGSASARPRPPIRKKGGGRSRACGAVQARALRGTVSVKATMGMGSGTGFFDRRRQHTSQPSRDQRWPRSSTSDS
jgi:hypothetical protein